MISCQQFEFDVVEFPHWVTCGALVSLYRLGNPHSCADFWDLSYVQYSFFYHGIIKAHGLSELGPAFYVSTL